MGVHAVHSSDRCSQMCFVPLSVDEMTKMTTTTPRASLLTLVLVLLSPPPPRSATSSPCSSSVPQSGHSKVINAVALRKQRPFRAVTGGDDRTLVFSHGGEGVHSLKRDVLRVPANGKLD